MQAAAPPPPSPAAAAAAASPAAAADSRAASSCLSFPLDPTAVVLGLGEGGGDKIFHFDGVLGDDCGQEQCYAEAKAAGVRACVYVHVCVSVHMRVHTLSHAPTQALLFQSNLNPKPVSVESVVQGFNVCIMAYGQVTPRTRATQPILVFNFTSHTRTTPNQFAVPILTREKTKTFKRLTRF